MRFGTSLLAIFALAPSALAICVIDPNQYISRPANAVVGRVGGGTCVPIGARFAVTANHVGVGSTVRLELDAVHYRVKATYPHPDAPNTDLKIIEIDGPPYFADWVPIHPDPLAIPTGTTVYIGGTGYAYGSSNGQCADWGERSEQWAMNNLEGFLADAYAWYRFDEELPNEGIATLFDSGSFIGVADSGNCSIALLGIAVSASTTGGPTCDGNSAYYQLIDQDWVAPYTGPICAGDLDADGDTDVNDFAILAGSFSHAESCAKRSVGDLNDDGLVNIHDFAILASDFGCSPDAPAQPDPPDDDESTTDDATGGSSGPVEQPPDLDEHSTPNSRTSPLP